MKCLDLGLTEDRHSQKLLPFFIAFLLPLSSEVVRCEEMSPNFQCTFLSSTPALPFINQPSLQSLSFSNGKMGIIIEKPRNNGDTKARVQCKETNPMPEAL